MRIRAAHDRPIGSRLLLNRWIQHGQLYSASSVDNWSFESGCRRTNRRIRVVLWIFAGEMTKTSIHRWHKEWVYHATLRKQVGKRHRDIRLGSASVSLSAAGRGRGKRRVVNLTLVLYLDQFERKTLIDHVLAYLLLWELDRRGKAIGFVAKLL